MPEVAIAGRGFAKMLFEMLGEILSVRVSHGKGDFFDAERSNNKQPRGLPETELREMSFEGEGSLLLKEGVKMRAAQIARRCYLCNCQLLVISGPDDL